MLNPEFYCSENVRRIRYAQICVGVLSAVICGYLVVISVLGLRETCNAERLLRREKKESFELLRRAGHLRQQDRQMRPSGADKVDAFAVTFSEWAEYRGLKVESLIPEGSPAPTEVAVGQTKLGVWNANKVRVKGRGPFPRLMELLDEFRAPRVPVQLESFAIRSAVGGDGGNVTFDLLLTIYEKQGGAS